MTGIAIILGGIAAMLLWAGITGGSPWKEFTATILGNKIPAKGTVK